MTFDFLETDSILREQALFASPEGGGAILATPEWLNEMLKSAWHRGNLAGDLAAYSGGMIREQNPFMTEQERMAYYGHAQDVGVAPSTI